MKQFPLISIVTVNYKQAQTTNELINSLLKVSWQNWELIVVDNNSGTSDTDKLRTDLPNIQIIKSDKNLGFAGGNNLGIARAKGDYILLLNNDTEVEVGFLEPMINWMIHNPKTGAVSPKIKFFYQQDTLQYAGFTKMNPFTLRMQGIGYGKKDIGQYEVTKPTEFAHGCAMMVSRKVIDKVGPMNEKYFLYYEEHDWSLRIKQAGFNIYYIPESVVWHKESVSVSKNSTLKTYFMNRNRILFMKLNLSITQQAIATLYLIFISLPRNIFKYFITKELNHLSAYLDAIIWNMNHKTKAKWNL